MTKVVKILQDMLKKSQEDGETERDLYAKFKCYCDDNEANKREEIKEYTQMIQELEANIDEVQADTGKLSTMCADYKAGMAENEQFRKDAQSVRDKELKAFQSEETDMVDGIGAMDQAIDTLSEVGADQTASSGADHAQFMGKKSLLKLKSSVKDAMEAVSVLLSHKQKRAMESFIQAPFTGTYTSQSGEIVGILKNMRDTFKQNLATIRAAEKAAAEAHDKIMKTKEAEFETMKTGYEEGQSKLGDNDDELADLREQLEELKGELEAAEQFLAKLLAMCAKKAKEFEERNMMRANEEAAISKAIAILNSDAAFEAFGKVDATKSGAMSLIHTKSGAMSFIQIEKHNQLANVRVNVIKLLEGAARKWKSVKIARIVLMLQADNPFDTVLEEIDKMIAIIEDEEKADVENKEWCESERAANHEEKESTEREIDTLEETINTLDDAINNPETGLIVMIADTEKSIQENHDNQAEQTASRAEENRAYQTNIKNIVVAEELLAKAIDVLKAYYSQFDKEEEEKFLQEEQEPNPNETWEGDYKGQSEQGGKVIETLEFIKKETKAEENDAHKVENEAQHAFEDEMAELKDEQKSLEETLAKYQLELAEKQKELAEKKQELKEAEAKLKAIEKYLLKIKPGCDYIAENYDTRKKNRNLEKDALKKAIGLIKGTPAYKKAVHAQEQEDLGDCKDICNEEGRDHAKCEACLAGTSVPGYCAGHKDTPGC